MLSRRNVTLTSIYYVYDERYPLSELRNWLQNNVPLYYF